MPVVISPQTKMTAYGVAALCTSALVAHYAMSLPDHDRPRARGVRHAARRRAWSCGRRR